MFFVKNYFMKQIYHRTSTIDGIGIFTGENIKKGEIISRIKGNLKFKINQNKEDALANPNWIGIEENKWIDPEKPYKFINHSCDPSCGIKGKITVVALKDLKEGEELTIDYAFIEGDEMWEMKCNCGEKNCRGTIRSIQFLPSEYFLKYFKYIPNYFKKLYIKSRKISVKQSDPNILTKVENML